MAMAMNLDGVFNALVISTFVHLVKVDKNKMHVFIDRMDDSALECIAKTFAVPLSSFFWCLIFMVAFIVSYGRQPGVPQIQLPTYQHGDVQPDTPDDQQSMPAATVTEPHLPAIAVIYIGLFTVLLILRFISVLQSVVRLRYSKLYGAETAHTDPESVAMATRGRTTATTASDNATSVLVTDAREGRDRE
ncbi:hypothetical protein BC835DRAFT_114601 [Cytidiella melzeri]|nr:hypothetical protein BC835DRAFT_114601 [Cytidiella melzeri]